MLTAPALRTSKPSKMREILRGPINLGSDEDADFARLHGDGAGQEPCTSRFLYEYSLFWFLGVSDKYIPLLLGERLKG